MLNQSLVIPDYVIGISLSKVLLDHGTSNRDLQQNTLNELILGVLVETFYPLKVGNQPILVYLGPQFWDLMNSGLELTTKN